jgi:hypothetical protein
MLGSSHKSSVILIFSSVNDSNIMTVAVFCNVAL